MQKHFYANFFYFKAAIVLPDGVVTHYVYHVWEACGGTKMANNGYFACKFGKKRLKNVTQKEFLTPAGAKKVKFRRGAASYKR